MKRRGLQIAMRYLDHFAAGKTVENPEYDSPSGQWAGRQQSRDG